VILTAFLIGLALVLAAMVVLVIRAIELWRGAKRSGGAITDELARFEERATRTEQLLAEAERANKDLQAATERLRLSRARLQVLLDSVEEARRRTRWLRAFLPTR
jgi:exopolyphosphatase/pppGpp-phosphohydrolase